MFFKNPSKKFNNDSLVTFQIFFNLSLRLTPLDSLIVCPDKIYLFVEYTVIFL